MGAFGGGGHVGGVLGGGYGYGGAGAGDAVLVVATNPVHSVDRKQL